MQKILDFAENLNLKSVESIKEIKNHIKNCNFQIMNDTHKVPTIKLACHAQNRLQDLESLSTGLEKCQKSLNDYLDSKRNAFPRFFFISDDELLSILGSSDPECVQEHMIKVLFSFGFNVALTTRGISDFSIFNGR